MAFARLPLSLALLWLLVPVLLKAQTAAPSGPRPLPVPKAVPLPKMPRQGASLPTEAAEPTSPAAQTVSDVRAHLSFRLPPGWELARQDGELSTYRLDARTAPHRAELRAVADLAFNPFPGSTFAGALFYLSVTPHTSASACAGQATNRPNEPLDPKTVADVKFERGHDEHGKICTEARDTVLTAMRRGSCVRFDMAINTFCGGDVSGAREITEAQLRRLQERFDAILQTVRFE